MFIYKVTNLINGKIYIGKTKSTPEKRLAKHIKNSETRVSRFYSAIKCYGSDNFIVETLESIFDESIIDEREKFWIKELGSQNPEIGYNMTPGGDGMLSEETRKKISEKMKGRKLSEKHKEKISIGNKGKQVGKNVSEETRSKISESLKKSMTDPEIKRKTKEAAKKRAKSGKDHNFFGKHHTDESKKIMSDAKKGKTWEEIFGPEEAARRKEKFIYRLKANNPNKKNDKKTCIDSENIGIGSN